MFNLDLKDEGIMRRSKTSSLVRYGIKRSKLKKNRNQRFAIKEDEFNTPIVIIKNGRVLKTTGTGVLDRYTHGAYKALVKYDIQNNK